MELRHLRKALAVLLLATMCITLSGCSSVVYSFVLEIFFEWAWANGFTRSDGSVNEAALVYHLISGGKTDNPFQEAALYVDADAVRAHELATEGFVLHDRSRLADAIELRPDDYQYQTMEAVMFHYDPFSYGMLLIDPASYEGGYTGMFRDDVPEHLLPKQDDPRTWLDYHLVTRRNPIFAIGDAKATEAGGLHRLQNLELARNLSEFKYMQNRQFVLSKPDDATRELMVLQLEVHHAHNMVQLWEQQAGMTGRDEDRAMLDLARQDYMKKYGDLDFWLRMEYASSFR